MGDFEGDTIVGVKYSGYIVTLVNRKTKYLLGRKVDNKKALCVSKVTRDLFADINTIQSVTYLIMVLSLQSLKIWKNILTARSILWIHLLLGR